MAGDSCKMVDALKANIQELLSERRFDPTIAGDLESYVEEQVLYLPGFGFRALVIGTGWEGVSNSSGNNTVVWCVCVA